MKACLLNQFIAFALSLAMPLAGAIQTRAQEQGENTKVIRDAEIEDLLRDYTKPIFKAAGIGGAGGIEFILVNDRSFNAFVADSHRIFITIGALLDSKTPNEVIGVLAHESGHIAGGHLARLRQELQSAQNASIIAMLLGVAAVAAGAAAGARGGDIGSAIGGVAMGSFGIGSRTMLAYQRTEEAAADRAAVNYLNATHQSGRGMIETFRRFADDSLVSAHLTDPYTLSHPMPRDRIANLENLVEASPYKDAKDPPALQARHDLMRAKIAGYLEAPQQVMRHYGNAQDLPARYARAIAATRSASLESGLKDMDGLIAAQPNNPYFHELKGQTLLENGRPREAIVPYRRAVELAPNSGLIRLGLGRALVSTEDKAMLDEAIRELERGILQDPESGFGYRFLGIAYARKGDEPHAALATAQGYFHDGNYQLAKQSAVRAKGLLPKGSPGWLKADDITNFKIPKK